MGGCPYPKLDGRGVPRKGNGAGEPREAFWELRETVRLDDSNHDAKVQFAQLSIFAGELEEARAETLQRTKEET